MKKSNNRQIKKVKSKQTKLDLLSLDNEEKDDVLIVDHLEEEYEYVSKLRCKCGGSMEIVFRAFRMEPLPRDVFVLKCEICSEKKKKFFYLTDRYMETLKAK